MFKKLVFPFLLLISAFSFDLQAQENNQKVYAGFGLGFDYGGIIGMKLEFIPIKYVSIFGSAGYTPLGLGANVGVNIKALPSKLLTPTVTAMYGYHGLIKVDGDSKYDKKYAGLTLGLGADYKVGKRGNKLSASIFVPLRSQQFKDDYDAVKAIPGITITQDLLPVAFSFGFNFPLGRR